MPRGSCSGVASRSRPGAEGDRRVVEGVDHRVQGAHRVAVRPRPDRDDPYAVLGLEPGATTAEIRRAYRRRAMAVHPDVAGSDATGEMARLNGARDHLESRSPDPVAADEARPRTRTRKSRPGVVEPERPAWTETLQETWPDYWSAWNDLPRRDRP
jgi:hypothetical protein